MRTTHRGDYTASVALSEAGSASYTRHRTAAVALSLLLHLCVEQFAYRRHLPSSLATFQRCGSYSRVTCPRKLHLPQVNCVIPNNFQACGSVLVGPKIITITSGQSNLTKGRIADAHGRFNRIRQVAPICTPSAFAQYRFCTLLSRSEYIDHGHVRASAVCHLGYKEIKFLLV